MVLDGIFAGGGFKVRKSGFIEVSQEVTTEHLSSVITTLRNLNEDAAHLRKLVAIAIGSLVLEHASRQKQSLAESVDSLDICKDYDVAKKTVLKWAKVVSMIPDAVLELPNLHMSHFDAAVSHSAPKDAGALRKFNRERDFMLQEISENPDGKGKRWVEDRMKALKDKYGVAPVRQEAIGNILKKMIWGYRILRLRSEIRLKLLEREGMTEPDLFAYIRGWEDELIVRKQIPDDVTMVSIPWHVKEYEDRRDQ